MKNPNVTILGATGAVGREMLKILEERNFPIGELRCLASARSVGKNLSFAGREIMVEEATDAAFTDADIVLGAAENDIARRFAPAIKATGAVFIDNSSAFRMDEDVPLVVPEINPEDALHHHGIIANPNCSTIITVVAVAALRRLSPITSMVAATYQAVSGAGAGGPEHQLIGAVIPLKAHGGRVTGLQSEVAGPGHGVGPRLRTGGDGDRKGNGLALADAALAGGNGNAVGKARLHQAQEHGASQQQAEREFSEMLHKTPAFHFCTMGAVPRMCFLMASSEVAAILLPES